MFGKFEFQIYSGRLKIGHVFYVHFLFGQNRFEKKKKK
jgi:hypothetical protein